jgi:hypothetical protein
MDGPSGNIYKPLPLSSNDFRLLYIRHSRHRKARLRGRLKLVSFKDPKPHSYATLSYA